MLPVDWKDRVKSFNMTTNPSEVLPILQALIDKRDKENIQWFYQNICTDTLDINDRDSFFSNFVLWFSNMKSYEGIKQDKEPTTGDNFLCFRCIYHRGEDDEFYIDVFFQKKELFDAPYRYNQFLMYNNLAGLETFLHVNELDKPFMSNKNMVQCNNIVLSFHWKDTEYEDILNPPIYLSWNWYDVLKDKFNELSLNFRNVLSDGENLIVVLDLCRTLTLKNKNLNFVLDKVQNKLLSELKDFHPYDNKGFFMVPGSINTKYKKTLKNRNHMYFLSKNLIDGELTESEVSYRKCYMLGESYYDTGLVSLTHLADMFYKEKVETNNLRTKTHRNNYVRYKKVGEQRLVDFDTLLLYRSFDIQDAFTYFNIMANVLLYLNKNEEEIILYMEEKNKLLKNGLTTSKLLQILTFQKNNYEAYKIDPKLGVKYSNDIIVRKLKITDFEQDKMLQLISKETAILRTRYHKREYARKAYEEKKQKNREKKEELKDKQVKENKNIKEMHKTKRNSMQKEEIELQIKEMLSLGIQVKEISEMLHVSKTKISNMKKEGEIRLQIS